MERQTERDRETEIARQRDRDRQRDRERQRERNQTATHSDCNSADDFLHKFLKLGQVSGSRLSMIFPRLSIYTGKGEEPQTEDERRETEIEKVN
jgi:hypothetical protein